MRLKMFEKICPICDEKFKGKEKQIVCSRKCSGKYIRQQQALKNKRKCIECNVEYYAKTSHSQYCRQMKESNCKNCEKFFKYICMQGHTSYCSSSCRNSYMRKYKYEISKKRKCLNCENNYIPTASSQKYCESCSVIKVTCLFCEELFEMRRFDLDKGRGLYCGNSCSTLAQTNSSLNRALIKEYKDPDQWAKNFRKAHKRKPARADWSIYFGVDDIPSKANKKFFLKTKSSNWEQIVVNYIEENFSQIKIIRLYKFKFKETHREIDIFLPEYNIGFEVQDFSTHSKDSNIEKGPFGFKNGPIYHKEKRDGALKLGITIIEIWEDSIVDGSFQKIVDESLVNIQHDTEKYVIINEINKMRG